MVRKLLRTFGLWFPGMGATDNAVLFAGIVLILLFAVFACTYGVVFCVEALRRGASARHCVRRRTCPSLGVAGVDEVG